MALPCSTEQAASVTGISTMTLYRWLAAGKLNAPKLCVQGSRAVRLWSKADLNRLSRLKQEIYCKGRGRKKGYKQK
jgi:excisionase family DNA binding protein